jgi:hypothetical protein
MQENLIFKEFRLAENLLISNDYVQNREDLNGRSPFFACSKNFLGPLP